MAEAIEISKENVSVLESRLQQEDQLTFVPVTLMLTEDENKERKWVIEVDENEIIRRRLLIDGDGAGDDKKITKLVDSYVRFVDADEVLGNIEGKIRYEDFNSLVKQCDALSSVVGKTFKQIEVQRKAKSYWELVMTAIHNQMGELRTLTASQREKLKQVEMRKRKSEEASAAATMLEGTLEREVAEERIKVLEQECKNLEEEHKELATLFNFRKQHVEVLCDLAKRLTNNSSEILQQALSDTEEKVLSDVSMDLD